MNFFNQKIELKKLPFDLRDCREEIGLVKSAVMKCPGIYFLCMYATAENFTGLSFYIVTQDADIPSEARSYGQTFPTHPDLLFFQYEGNDYGYKVIEYEILKFYVKHDLPFREYGDIHAFALYGMEVCPDYFGTFPVPILTPWGYTTRYKALHPGAFWIETSQCKTTVAVSYVMRDDFSDEVFNLAKLTHFDKENGLDKTMGYFFFAENDICLIVFELLNCEENVKKELIDIPALMNAIFLHHPDYALHYNLREQWGENDQLGMVMRLFDPTVELRSSEDSMIKITPEAGVDFFVF